MRTMLLIKAPTGATHLHGGNGMTPPVAACGLVLDEDLVEVTALEVTAEKAPRALGCKLCNEAVQRVHDELQAKAARRVARKAAR